MRNYFDLLERTHGLRAFLDRARADIAARPDDLAPVARVFYYYQRAGNVGAAEQALADFEARRGRARRDRRTSCLTLARLYEKTRNHNEALRYYSAIYSLPGRERRRCRAGAREHHRDAVRRAGAAAAVRQRRSLVLPRHRARSIRYPGFLNGVLSLLFNSASPADQFASEEAASGIVFSPRPRRRSAGAVRHAIPGVAAARRSERDADRDLRRVRRSGRRHRSRPPVPGGVSGGAAADRRRAGDGRRVRPQESGRRRACRLRPAASGAGGARRSGAARRTARRSGRGATAVARIAAATGQGARSQEYARVLDRYISRLVSLERLPDAFAVYRREIDRNPDDPGLYAAAAQFLEQNNVTAEVEQTYRRAMQQFPDRSWHHRLARWYLRRSQTAAFETLTRDVVRAFDGTELAGYFDERRRARTRGQRSVVSAVESVRPRAFPASPHVRPKPAGGVQRQSKPGPGGVTTALLRRHWFEDERPERAVLRDAVAHRPPGDASLPRCGGPTPRRPHGNWARLAKDNPVAARFVAEADIWRVAIRVGDAGARRPGG